MGIKNHRRLMMEVWTGLPLLPYRTPSITQSHSPNKCPKSNKMYYSAMYTSARTTATASCAMAIGQVRISSGKSFRTTKMFSKIPFFCVVFYALLGIRQTNTQLNAVGCGKVKSNNKFTLASITNESDSCWETVNAHSIDRNKFKPIPQ